MVILILVEIFILLTCSDILHCFYQSILTKSVHGHGQNKYWIKTIAVKHLDPLQKFGKIITIPCLCRSEVNDPQNGDAFDCRLWK